VEELSEPESQSHSQSSIQSQSQSQPRSVSPAPTEVDDPEPEYLEEQLQNQGIKIRDFGFEPRLAPILPTVRAVIPELFDQHEGLAEFEYRMAQKPRLFAMNPKTLRRLLDIGWVTMDEVRTRGEQRDLEELAKYDSKPPHPFVLRNKGERFSRRPSPEETASILSTKRFMLTRLDRMRRNAEADAERRERDAREVEESARRKGKGRATETGEKRKRFEDDWESQEWSQQSQQKQYPAPLASYDPEIYPEAAGVIESQQLSQGRPVPPPRADTPPIEELEARERRRQEQENRPNGLKRGLKRTLSRTQTFTQL
jgi:hypothetical protein